MYVCMHACIKFYTEKILFLLPEPNSNTLKSTVILKYHVIYHSAMVLACFLGVQGVNKGWWNTSIPDTAGLTVPGSCTRLQFELYLKCTPLDHNSCKSVNMLAFTEWSTQLSLPLVSET